MQNTAKLEKENLTTKQLRAIPFILMASSIEEAAKQAKVTRDTINRWMRKKHFKKVIEAKRQELFDAGLNRLKASTDKAALTMIELLDSEDESTKRLAAKDILSFSLKALEVQNLEERIERIEDLLEKRFAS